MNALDQTLHAAGGAGRASTSGAPDLPIEATALDKYYDGQAALDGASLRLEPGAVLGLIGRNGAGKSTLIRALLGLVAPDAGSARLFGRPALQLDDTTRARLSYVPQQPEALGWLKVGDMLDFVGRFYPYWDAAFVSTTLDRWGLPANKALAKLSPGERQRVAIIRALAPRPELLVLDEPAAALDPVARRELLREIAERAGEAGTSVLFSTHIVSDLERVASHVAFMHEGRMVLQAEMDTLKERHLRLRIPAAAVDGFSGRVPGEIARRRLPDGALSVLIVRTDDTAWPALAEAPGVRADTLSLEDLFVEAAE